MPEQNYVSITVRMPETLATRVERVTERVAATNTVGRVVVADVIREAVDIGVAALEERFAASQVEVNDV